MEVNLKTLTPLWTGDVDRRCISVKETGIMGSLRWWTEAILRGMDEFACDPTEEDGRCPKSKESNLNISYYCVSCLVFGATGLRRTFKLFVNGGREIFDGGPIKIQPKDRARGWFLGSGLKERVKLNLIPLDNGFDKNLVLVPLAIASNWGGIGAKTQQGYGVVRPEGLFVKIENFEVALNKIKESRLSKNRKLRKENNDSLPNIKEMFFAKIQFEADSDWWKEVDGIKRELETDKRLEKWVSSGSVPVAPAIKNWLRYGDGQKLWKKEQNNDRQLENWLFGSIGINKSASKISSSCAYITNRNKWEYRIWGWIPEDNSSKEFDRKNFLQKLKGSIDGRDPVRFLWRPIFGNHIQGHRLKVWREFASSRDTVKPNENEIKNYLQSLLNGEEEVQ